MHGSRGCLGCLTKPPVIVSMDEPSKGQGTGKKDERLEDLWSSSTLEMDQSAVQSQKSMSSIGISNQPSDPQSSGGATHIHHPEFINHGLVLWHQIRQQWVESRMCESHTQIGEPRKSWNASYESVLGSNNPFRHTVPLGEMVDFLVDIWEQEGLYEATAAINFVIILLSIVIIQSVAVATQRLESYISKTKPR